MSGHPTLTASTCGLTDAASSTALFGSLTSSAKMRRWSSRIEALKRTTEKKVPSAGRIWRTLLVIQGESDEAPDARGPAHQDEGLSRRRGRPWQNLPDPTVRPGRGRPTLNHD